uniref:Uncharacterized protein n=1 Tax=Anguilla anguilla TaxID=7936 RepID=A0A0E9XGE4_ANGAN
MCSQMLAWSDKSHPNRQQSSVPCFYFFPVCFFPQLFWADDGGKDGEGGAFFSFGI